MLPALILFLLTYLLMLALPQYRPFAALGGAALFLALGAAGLWDFTLMDAARAVDFNVLLMMAGMMGTVFLFIQSKMPARLAEELIAHVPDVRWAVSVLALLAGLVFLSALARALYLPGTSDGRTLCAGGLAAFALCLCWELPTVLQTLVQEGGGALLTPTLLFRLGLCCVGALGALSAVRCTRTEQDA